MRTVSRACRQQLRVAGRADNPERGQQLCSAPKGADMRCTIKNGAVEVKAVVAYGGPVAASDFKPRERTE